MIFQPQKKPKVKAGCTYALHLIYCLLGSPHQEACGPVKSNSKLKNGSSSESKPAFPLKIGNPSHNPPSSQYLIMEIQCAVHAPCPHQSSGWCSLKLYFQSWSLCLLLNHVTPVTRSKDWSHIIRNLAGWLLLLYTFFFYKWKWLMSRRALELVSDNFTWDSLWAILNTLQAQNIHWSCTEVKKHTSPTFLTMACVMGLSGLHLVHTCPKSSVWA